MSKVLVVMISSHLLRYKQHFSTNEMAAYIKHLIISKIDQLFDKVIACSCYMLNNIM